MKIIAKTRRLDTHRSQTSQTSEIANAHSHGRQDQPDRMKNPQEQGQNRERHEFSSGERYARMRDKYVTSRKECARRPHKEGARQWSRSDTPAARDATRAAKDAHNNKRRAGGSSETASTQIFSAAMSGEQIAEGRKTLLPTCPREIEQLRGQNGQLEQRGASTVARRVRLRHQRIQQVIDADHTSTRSAATRKRWREQPPARRLHA